MLIEQRKHEKCPRCLDLELPLTPEQQRLYDRLREYCAVDYMWCGNACKLAAFADLPYPFHPDVITGLRDRNLIVARGIPDYYITICEQEVVQ